MNRQDLGPVHRDFTDRATHDRGSPGRPFPAEPGMPTPVQTHAPTAIAGARCPAPPPHLPGQPDPMGQGTDRHGDGGARSEMGRER